MSTRTVEADPVRARDFANRLIGGQGACDGGFGRRQPEEASKCECGWRVGLERSGSRMNRIAPGTGAPTQQGGEVTGTYFDDSVPGRRPITSPTSGTFKDGVLSYGTTEAVVKGSTMTGTMRGIDGTTLQFTANRTQ